MKGARSGFSKGCGYDFLYHTLPKPDLRWGKTVKDRIQRKPPSRLSPSPGLSQLETHHGVGLLTQPSFPSRPRADESGNTDGVPTSESEAREHSGTRECDRPGEGTGAPDALAVGSKELTETHTTSCQDCAGK